MKRNWAPFNMFLGDNEKQKQRLRQQLATINFK